MEHGRGPNLGIAEAHLRGATFDSEENYPIKKLFTGGLRMVCVSSPEVT